jgi:hypothetical protein
VSHTKKVKNRIVIRSRSKQMNIFISKCYAYDKVKSKTIDNNIKKKNNLKLFQMWRKSFPQTYTTKFAHVFACYCLKTSHVIYQFQIMLVILLESMLIPSCLCSHLIFIIHKLRSTYNPSYPNFMRQITGYVS